MSEESGRLAGYYRWRDDKRSLYLKVSSPTEVSWEEGGREHRDKLQIDYGDFGPAEGCLRERSGLENYNMRLTTVIEDWEDEHSHGIVTSDGATLHLFYASPMTYVRISEAEVRKLGERRIDRGRDIEILTLITICSDGDLGDPISAPPGPFKPRPGVKGKFIWLDGAPGVGKSTTAQLLARNKGLS